MKSARLRNMEQYILENGTVTMAQLCEEMKISINTARLDVAALVSQGKVEKIYGGVAKCAVTTLVPFENRQTKSLESKKAIAKKAASFVEDNNIIFIDSGTTTMHMLDFMADKKNVVVLTNNLSIINSASKVSNIEVYVMPGKLDKNTNSIVSTDTIATLERYNITKCFMATTGISSDGGVTNSSLLEYALKQYITQKAKNKYLLVDNTKYNNPALMTYANLSDFDAVITDGGKSSDLVKLCKEINTTCELVDLDK